MRILDQRDTEQYPDRESWLRARRAGLGGSDAPAALGVDPYKSRLELWADKTGQVQPPDETSEAAEWGQRLEPILLKKLQEKTGRQVVPQQHLIVRHPNGTALTSPDAFCLDPQLGWGIVQAKTTSAFLSSEWKDEPPLKVQVQIQHEMETCGVHWGTICVLIGGQKFVPFDVRRNERFVESMLDEEHRFWKLVKSGTAPEADDSKSAARTLNRLYSTGNGQAVHLCPESEDWDLELVGLKQQIAMLDRAKKRLESRLKQEIGEASLGILPDGSQYSLSRIAESEYTVKREAYTRLTKLRKKAR